LRKRCGLRAFLLDAPPRGRPRTAAFTALTLSAPGPSATPSHSSAPSDTGALDELSLDWLQSGGRFGRGAALRRAFLEQVRDSGVTLCVTLTDYDQTLGTLTLHPQAILATSASRRAKPMRWPSVPHLRRGASTSTGRR